MNQAKKSVYLIYIEKGDFWRFANNYKQKRGGGLNQEGRRRHGGAA